MRRTVVPGFFLGNDHAQLAVISAVSPDSRRLQIHTFKNNAWTLTGDFALRRSVLFVDVARIGQRDWFITLSHDGVHRVDPATGEEQELVTLKTAWGETDSTEVLRLDLFQDLTGNGLDDLVIPGPDGFRIATQTASGVFSTPIIIGPPEPYFSAPGLDDSGLVRETTYGDSGVTYFNLPLYQSRLHRIDHNRDGRVDLAFWNDRGFDVYHQDPMGRFPASPQHVPCAVPVDSDGVYTRIFDFADDGVVAFLFGAGKASRRTVLLALTDMNGDGIEDLVTLTMTGRSPIRQRSQYRVYLGAVTEGAVEFNTQAHTSISPRGKVVGMAPWGYSSHRLADFNADGFPDLALAQVNIGLGGMVRALVGNSASVSIEIYRSQSGVFPTQPGVLRRFGWSFERGSFFPPILGGDFNGDGLQDLLVGRRRDRLEIYPGVSEPNLLETRPQVEQVRLPDDGRHVSLIDFNRDGKQDLLLNRAPTAAAPDSRSGIATLIAR